MNVQRTGRPAVGEQVNVEGVGLCEILSNDDPSLVTLKRPGGATLKIGERALRERLRNTVRTGTKPAPQR